MKNKHFIVFLTCIFFAVHLCGQGQQGFKWQGLAKDAAGNPVTQPVTLTFSILQNSAAVYTETHAPIVPINGQLTATVGMGTPTQGSFSGIDWSVPSSLNVKMKVGSGAVVDMGSSVILPVPMALYAAKSGDNAWSMSGNDVFRINGNVGIGTTEPKEKIQIGDRFTFHSEGSKYIALNSYWDGTNDRRLVDGPSSRLRFPASGNLELQVAGVGTADSTISFFSGLTVANNGRIGIGTSTPEKQLHLRGDGFIKLEDTGANGGWGEVNYSSDNSLRLIAHDGTGYGGIDIIPGGRVGIGTTTPEKQLHLRGDGFIKLEDTGADGGWGEVNYSSDNSLRLIAHDGNENGGIDIRPNGNVGIGTSNPTARLHVNGTAKTKILEITGGDVAEARHSATGEKLPVGSVVVFDETEKGKIRLTTKAYDKKVAGVISGAGNYFAGVCLLQEELSKGAQPVAQIGTVEVLAIGPIEVGDLLTTSQVPGYAMKAKKERKCLGAVIGKATSSLKHGERGLVEMQIEKH